MNRHLEVVIRRRDYLIKVATHKKALEELAALSWVIEQLKECGVEVFEDDTK